MHRFATLAAALLLTSCASRAIPPGPAPVANQTVQVWREELQDNSNSILLWARNDGERPAVVTEVRLYSCSNLFQDCTTVHPNVEIAPGATVQVLRLDPSNHGRRPSFGWEYRWRGLPAAGSTVAIAATPLEQSAIRLEPIDVDEFTPLVAADDAGGQCVPAPRFPGPTGSRTLMMRFGGDGQAPARRSVLVRLDSAGAILGFSDTRGDLRVAPPQVADAPRVRNPGPRTDINVNPVQATAVLMNIPVDGPPQRFLAHGDSLLYAQSLGAPIWLIRRIILDCGGK